jgi:hypothetical protein
MPLYLTIRGRLEFRTYSEHDASAETPAQGLFPRQPRRLDHASEGSSVKLQVRCRQGDPAVSCLTFRRSAFALSCSPSDS